MDANALHECFLGTLQADQAIRQNSEIQLKHASETVGFLGACLDILNAEEANSVVKKACSIYFKNKIMKNWGNPNGTIDNDEKPIIRERVIPTIVNLERQLRNQFIPVLNTMISYDYPSKWPAFLPSAISLFKDLNDIHSLYTGVLCFSELARHYRWKQNTERGEELDPIITSYFPSLLQIGKSIIADPAAHDSNYEAGEIVKLIVKAYKFVTYHDLPLPLQQQQMLLEWGTFHVDLINMKLPQSVLDIDDEDRSLSPWVKSQKWAFANLYRLFERYGSKSLSKRFSYDEFRELFVSHVVPELLNVYFKKLELWKAGQAWISDASMYHLISFLEQCVVQKPTWLLIKPHISSIISEVAFPILCPSDEVLDMFENDPSEYIHMILDIYEETSSPQMGIISMIFTLVEKRTKSTLEPILQFAYEKLSSFSNQPETLEIAKQKESALRIIGSIAYKLTSEKSTVRSQMEPFIAAFVLPNFQSQFAFLRARTCEVSSKFDRLEFQDQANLNTLFQGVMNCFNEVDNLPVQLEGALAIQAFMSFEQFKEALGTIIVETMEKLLDLSNKVESDAVSGVIQECVESYSEQLQPFGVSLMSKLSEQLMRLLSEINEASSGGPESIDQDDISEKHSAALGVFNTMITVLLYFENSAELIGKLEECYAPVIQFTLTNNLDDFYAEAAELIENTTFLTRTVSPTMWKLFEYLIMALMNNDLLLFLEDVVPTLRNYMVYGGETLKLQKDYQSAIFQMIDKLFNMDPEEDDIGANDIMSGADLATNFILSLDSSCAATYIPTLVGHALKSLANRDKAHSSKKFSVSLLNIIIAGLVVDPNTTLQVLVTNNAVQDVFALWFTLVPSLKLVFDLKLAILGYLSIISIDLPDLANLELNNLLSEFGSKLAVLFTELPKAIKRAEKSRSEFNPEDRLDKFDESELFSADQQFDEEDDLGEDNDDNVTAAEAYLQFLQEQTEVNGGDFSNFGEIDDDEFNDDDPYSNTTLDNINVFKAFKDCFIGIQSSDPTKYGLIAGSLTPSEQEILTNIASITTEQ